VIESQEEVYPLSGDLRRGLGGMVDCTQCGGLVLVRWPKEWFGPRSGGTR
jgi:hypothetical protein